MNLSFNGTRFSEEEYSSLSTCLKKSSFASLPFLTLIIPTYNRLELFKEAFKSALTQVQEDFQIELLIISDKPNNKELHYFLKDSPEFVSFYEVKHNLGLFEAMNLGVRLAKAEWVAFLHDDDLLKENYLKEIYRLLHRHRDVGAIMVSTVQIGNVTYRSRIRESFIYRTLKPIKDKLSIGKLYRLRIFDNILWCADQYGAPSCGSVWRKKYFLALGGYNEKAYPSGDWFFMVEFTKHYKVYKTTQQLGYYRWSDNASTKPEIIRKFITDNLYLREYFREHYLLGKIIYHLTKKEHYRHIIDVFLTFDKTGQLKPHDFDDIYPYPKNSLRYFLYLNGQRAYWVLRVMMSLLIG